LVHTALLKANFMMPLSNFIPIVPAALQGWFQWCWPWPRSTWRRKFPKGGAQP
jgi:hypothetical protein